MSEAYRVKVDKDRVIGKINRQIYGYLVEHVGRCVYGGIYEEGSSLSDERGFRKDVLEALRKARCPCVTNGLIFDKSIGLKLDTFDGPRSV